MRNSYAAAKISRGLAGSRDVSFCPGSGPKRVIWKEHAVSCYYMSTFLVICFWGMIESWGHYFNLPLMHTLGEEFEASVMVQRAIETDILCKILNDVCFIVIGQFGLEESVEGPLIQPPEQVYLQLHQVFQSPIQPDLDSFQGWVIHQLSVTILQLQWRRCS